MLYCNFVCILCSFYHISYCSVSHPVLFVNVLYLLWSVNVLQMKISCMDNIQSGTEHHMATFMI